MPLYTKTGDEGQTSLANQQRVSKASPQVEAYGDIDELNSHLGLLRAMLDDTEPLLAQIQRDLFTIGAIVAGGTMPTPMVRALEQAIDAMTQPWRGFVLPGGCARAAEAHVCRTICRRAERHVVALNVEPNDSHTALHDVVIYLNRLSDYLYALALDINTKNNIGETFWQK